MGPAAIAGERAVASNSRVVKPGDLFFALLEERQEERIRHLRRTLASAEAADLALEDEARDATRSLKESREWRLLLFEFVANIWETLPLSPK